jgi:nucleotide-binding universal stress UspA family protein
MRKIIIAVDGSPCALKAVDYTARQFSGITDVRITLLHVLPYLATSLWDDGHILTKEEREARKKVVDTWTRNQQQRAEPIFREAVQTLTRKGILPEQIETKTISDSSDVAESILEETRNGGYQTLVVGRRGVTAAKRFLMGSVTNKVINQGAGSAICVVE